MKDRKSETDALLVQRHQQIESQKKVGELRSGIEDLKKYAVKILIK